MADYQQMDIPEFPKNGKKIIILVAIGLIAFMTFWKSSITINSGEAGVLFEKFSGGVNLERTFDEGFHIIAPWNDMIVYDVKQQDNLETMSVLSSNGLEITLEVTTWYHPIYEKLPYLHKYKKDYLNQIVKPAIRSASRSVIGRYTPEEIYSSKRDIIQTEINIETEKIFLENFIQIEGTLVRDIKLPPTIKMAIENKLKQEQESLEYEFKLQKAKKEAEKVMIEARGKAEANRILNASLTANILKEKGIEATLKLAQSPNTKVVVIGGADGLPLILGGQ